MDFLAPDRLYTYFARLIVLFTSMPIHEFAHGWVAYKLGDDTARYQGRLDLNPLSHLDPLGTILILFTGFGWAKPVPINPNRFNRKISMRAGVALTAVAGPVANILLATVILLLYKILFYGMIATGVTVAGNAVQIIAQILSLMVSINVGLAVFNLLPIPPLDGYNIVSYFIPARWDYKISQYSQYIFIGLFAVIMFTPILDIPLYVLRDLIYKFLNFATSFVDLFFKMMIR